jgi:gluconate kinase
MTIRNRLTWLFVSVVAVLLLAVLSVVFLLQSSASQREFRQRLRDRAQVTSYIYLEKDEMRTCRPSPMKFYKSMMPVGGSALWRKTSVCACRMQY